MTVPLPPSPPPPAAEDARRGCGRWLSVGCGALVVVLAVLMVGGFFLLRRGVHWAAERARERIVQRLPADLSDAEQRQVRQDLQRFFEKVAAERDPGPLMGEFLSRAGDALEDGRLSRDEVESLDGFLRRAAGGGSEATPPPAAGR